MYFTAIVPLFCVDVTCIEKLSTDSCFCKGLNGVWFLAKVRFILGLFHFFISLLLSFGPLLLMCFVSLWPTVWTLIFLPLIWPQGLGVFVCLHVCVCVCVAVKPKGTPTVVRAIHLRPVKRENLWIRLFLTTTPLRLLLLLPHVQLENTRVLRTISRRGRHIDEPTIIFSTKIIFRAYLRSPSWNGGSYVLGCVGRRLQLTLWVRKPPAVSWCHCSQQGAHTPSRSVTLVSSFLVSAWLWTINVSRIVNLKTNQAEY